VRQVKSSGPRIRSPRRFPWCFVRCTLIIV
jgi:hypothetical protein